MDMPSKTHYDVLGVGPMATADEIKQAFRRQISQYHPDKVQHLGPEIQAVAAERTWEITNAYHHLSNPERRTAYDRRSAPPPSASPAVPSNSCSWNRDPATGEPVVEPPAPPRDLFRQDRATRDGFVRRASLARLQEATAVELGDPTLQRRTGFDVAYRARAKRSLLKREPTLMICGVFAVRVDACAVREAWMRAVRLGPVTGELCVFLLGDALAPTGELSHARTKLSRRGPRAGAPRITVIPVDVNDWQGSVPDDAPPAAQRILARLQVPV